MLACTVIPGRSTTITTERVRGEGAKGWERQQEEGTITHLSGTRPHQQGVVVSGECMSSRPPSPRSLRSLRGRCIPTLRGSSGFTGNVGHDNDELMTINENRNVGGGGGSGSAGGNEASDGNESESSHANSSISVSSVSSTSSSASSTTSSTSGSEGAPSDPSSLLHGESGRHSMDASSSCNACSSLVLDNNHPFPHEHDRPLMNGCEDMWSWNKRDRSKEVWLSRSDNRRVYFHPNWSKGTAGIRGTRVLNNGRYYWEISLTQRVFGTR